LNKTKLFNKENLQAGFETQKANSSDSGNIPAPAIGFVFIFRLSLLLNLDSIICRLTTALLH
jgi:hypothetical protein